MLERGSSHVTCQQNTDVCGLFVCSMDSRGNTLGSVGHIHHDDDALCPFRESCSPVIALVRRCQSEMATVCLCAGANGNYK